MDCKIIVDSCCDLTPQLKERFNLITVPMSLKLGASEFIDDESLNINHFLSEMRACKGKACTSAPNPLSFQTAIESANEPFVVTLSSQLSGAYSNALLGKTLAEENGKTTAHVFDSKSASAGEVLVAVKIRELLMKGLPKEQVVNAVNSFIDGMKTYFVLERYENLLKSGRLSRITGKIISVLNIKLVMGSDGKGNIALFAKPRGIVQAVEKMLAYIKESGKKTDGENLVIAHCDNPSLAAQISSEIVKYFNFKEIFVVPMGGTTSLYADEKGIVLAF